MLDNGGAEEELNRERLESLRLEIERLRAEVARLRAKNAELVAEAVNRNYERPPHYQ